MKRSESRKIQLSRVQLESAGANRVERINPTQWKIDEKFRPARVKRDWTITRGERRSFFRRRLSRNSVSSSQTGWKSNFKFQFEISSVLTRPCPRFNRNMYADMRNGPIRRMLVLLRLRSSRLPAKTAIVSLKLLTFSRGLLLTY